MFYHLPCSFILSHVTEYLISVSTYLVSVSDYYSFSTKLQKPLALPVSSLWRDLYAVIKRSLKLLFDKMSLMSFSHLLYVTHSLVRPLIILVSVSLAVTFYSFLFEGDEED